MMASLTSDRSLVHSSTPEAVDSRTPRRAGRPGSPERGLRGTIAANPGLLPAAGTLPVVVWMVAHDGGYNTTTWDAAGIWFALLLGVLLLTLPAPRRPSVSVLVALGC